MEKQLEDLAWKLEQDALQDGGIASRNDFDWFSLAKSLLEEQEVDRIIFEKHMGMKDPKDS